MNEAEASVHRNVNLANYHAWAFWAILDAGEARARPRAISSLAQGHFPKDSRKESPTVPGGLANNSSATVLSDLSDESLNGRPQLFTVPKSDE
jgi:hypothetical protein